MNCEKCQDMGFTEEEHGLIRNLCDCDKAREVAEREGIPKVGYYIEDGVTLEETPAEAEPFEPDIYTGEVNDSNSGTGLDNPATGSADTSQPKQPRKSKKAKRAAKRAG